MRRILVLSCLPIMLLWAARPQSLSQSSTNSSGPLFTVKVDEVSLTFHAYDDTGQSVDSLTPGDLTIYDNYKPPGKILLFKLLRDQPVRSGILLDTSESMQDFISRSRAVATEYIRQHLRQQFDHAFIEDFGYVSRILQPWTGDSSSLSAGIAEAVPGPANPRGGTAIFETLYSTCLYQFGRSDPPSSGNVILLFTDGVDISSHVDLKSAIDLCQRANVAVYIFAPEQRGSSTGPANVSRLTSETGGRMFHLEEGDAEIRRDLNRIDADARNEYWLVYRPADLRRDGSFHSIYVGTSRPDTSIDVRAGYYAPTDKKP
jgi:Ca-activated chloride channel homolog